MYLVAAFIFGIVVDLDLGKVGIEGQGRRSKVKFKSQKSFLHQCYIAVRSRSKVGVKVKGRGQDQISAVQRSILGARLCRVQQGATTTVNSLR